MSIKRNIVANYLGQFYVTAIGIVMVPIYIHYMGAETYGLIGFFATLQALFQLLDMGLSATLTREVARYRGGSVDGAKLLGLIRALEVTFFGLAFAAVCLMLFLSDSIANTWLTAEQLSRADVSNAVALMGAIASLRLVSGLYRGVINGFEQQVWLNAFNVVIATLRFIMVIPIFIYVGVSPSVFFVFQLVITLAELSILVASAYRFLPPKLKVSGNGVFTPIRDVFRFSATVSFAGLVGVIITQSDKAILAKALSLTEYGYFSIIIVVAGALHLVGGPISQALLPRMAKLEAEGEELLQIYRSATQLLAVIMAPIALVMAVFSEEIIWAWIGDRAIAQKAGAILTLYALGNLMFGLAAFPYYLQYAKGNLRLHLLGNLIMLSVLVPCQIAMVWRFGAYGAGLAWLAINTIYFFAWVPIVHARFAKGMHRSWLLHDIGKIVFPLAVLAGVLNYYSYLISGIQNRFFLAAAITLCWILSAALAASVSPFVRRHLLAAFDARRWFMLKGLRKGS